MFFIVPHFVEDGNTRSLCPVSTNELILYRRTGIGTGTEFPLVNLSVVPVLIDSLLKTDRRAYRALQHTNLFFTMDILGKKGTTQPTKQPSKQPTKQPTKQPSNQPTNQPTKQTTPGTENRQPNRQVIGDWFYGHFEGTRCPWNLICRPMHDNHQYRYR